jgi:hypothetical protein
MSLKQCGFNGFPTIMAQITIIITITQFLPVEVKANINGAKHYYTNCRTQFTVQYL